MYPALTQPRLIYPTIHPPVPSDENGEVLTKRVHSAAKNSFKQPQSDALEHSPKVSALIRGQIGPLDLSKHGPKLPFSQGQNSSHDLCMHAQDHSPFGTTSEGGRQYFDPQSDSSVEVGMSRRSRSMSSESNLWIPLSSSSSDAKAAHLGAELTAQASVRLKSASKRPGMIAVIQDQKGNAVGGLAIKKDEQPYFNSVRSMAQSHALDQVGYPRGNGHGYCAEQSVLHKAMLLDQAGRIQLKSSNITAIGTGKREGIRTEACDSCRHTNQVFGLQDTVTLRPQTSFGLITSSSVNQQRSPSISSRGFDSPLSSRASISSFSSIPSTKSLLKK